MDHLTLLAILSGGAGGDNQLVVMNPTFIAGPSLVAALRSALTGFKAVIEGTVLTLPRQRFGVVDVRDVAEAHNTAMVDGATWTALPNSLDLRRPTGSHFAGVVMANGIPLSSRRQDSQPRQRGPGVRPRMLIAVADSWLPRSVH